MPERKLRIVRKSPPPVIGVCERCNAEFKSTELSWEDADAEIAEVFAAHKCKLMDSSQNALRIVRESTEGN
jgi:hypothetical protein